MVSSNTSSYCVSLEKDNLVFSAAHFITFNGDVCEQLHGHNYRVKCKVFGPLDENGYVIDFIALRDTLTGIVATLDHRTLLPTEHPSVLIEQLREKVTTDLDRIEVAVDENRGQWAVVSLPW